MQQEAKQTIHTPAMQQYYAIKKQYEGMLLFFQMGDFYELFFEDAKIAAHFLGITLTKRGKANGSDIPLCGVPVHAIDHYLGKLIKGGYKVALCCQLEEAQPGVTVKRGVTRVFTPGTLVETHFLDEKSPSYLCTFLPTQTGWGLLFGEVMTAQLFFTQLPVSEERLLENELARFFPDEIVIPCKVEKQFHSLFKKLGYILSGFNPYTPEHKECQEKDRFFSQWIKEQFNDSVQSMVASSEGLKQALFYFYAYMDRTHQKALDLFKTVTFYTPHDFLQIDSKTQKNLELVNNTYDHSRAHTLLNVIDRSITPMGSRLLKKWIVRPLVQERAIVQRQEIVEWLINNQLMLKQIQEQLHVCADVERSIGRILIHKGLMIDFLLLKNALKAVEHIKILLHSLHMTMPLLTVLYNNFVALPEIMVLLEHALEDDFSNEFFIKEGYSSALDELRYLMLHATEQLLKFEKQEQERTGIATLKIRFNTIHGYYIEMSKIGALKAPSFYTPLQSLVGKERYVTQDLELLTHRIHRAKADFAALQESLFGEIKTKVHMQATALRKICNALAHLDALTALADCALTYKYVKPSFTEKKECVIVEGRHPVVEQHLTSQFIANDTLITQEDAVWIITGPNMGGKSTYLRQVALICVMAHIGSFVPAKKAEIPLLDTIFTRIGSGDFVAGGKSTFLVEMEETAQICLSATHKSLVILDEVGRGTSTVDGRSIAQAVLEYLARSDGPLCLFATHYHELTQLQTTHAFISAYYMASKKTDEGIIFLYQLVKGVADGSFGIEIAKLAGIPPSVITRAQKLCEDALHNELHEKKQYYIPAVRETTKQEHSLQFDQVKHIINTISIDDLTPRKAFEIMCKLHELLSSKM